MLLKDDDVVVVSALRTPIGKLQGSLKSVSAPRLGAACIKALLENTAVKPNAINEVIMGCVLSAGLGQAPARQAAIYGNLPYETGATTINKMCGSGMKAVMLAMDSLRLNPQHMLIAGGMESMTNAPYLLPGARNGFRLGHRQCVDHLFIDGLEDAYGDNQLMGVFAEKTASEFQFSREAQDNFAIESLRRAQKAIDDKAFANEITPIVLTTADETQSISVDENPINAKIEKIATLKPAFCQNGTVTAANSSSISDGAAALMLTTAKYANTQNLKPIAKLCAHATYSVAPEQFTTAPVGAIKKVLSLVNWSVNDVDLFEINEAFAVVTMAAMQNLQLPSTKVNIHGGACALGHPIGASGARILVTLINALTNHGLHKGVASLCIGGGEATAIAVERIK